MNRATTSSYVLAPTISPSMQYNVANHHNHSNNNNTLQPKQSYSPMSRIKFRTINKKRSTSNSQKRQMNMNEKFQLIAKKHGTSSSSFIEDDDFFNNSTSKYKSDDSNKRSTSSSLKRYFQKFSSDSKDDSQFLETKNLFKLKSHRPSTSVSCDDGGFNVLDF